MAKIKLIALLLVISLFAFRLWQSTGCRHFSSFFFNPLSIKINVESQISTDLELNRNIARFFHNKITVGFFEVTKSYTATIDPRFLFGLFGPLGLFLAVIMVINVFKNPKINQLGHLGVILVTSAFIIGQINPKISYLLLSFTWYSFAARGIAYFPNKISQWLIFMALLIISFWYFIFDWQMYMICSEIFFN